MSSDAVLDTIDRGQSIKRIRNPLKIRVRVISLWRIPEHLQSLSLSSMEMVLIDKEGEKMEAVVLKEEPIKQNIVEGGVYRISKFKVVPNIGSHRYTRHSYTIILHSGTKISLCEDDRIPRDGWYFVHLENISIVGDKFGYLVDVIGLLSSASSPRMFIKDKRIYKKMVIDILDNTGKCRCVLIGDVVDTLNEYLCLDWINRPVVGFRFVDVRRVDGKTTINCIPYVSKIYINHVFEEDWIVGNRFSGLYYDIPVEYIGFSDSNVNVKVDMLELNPKKSIGQLITTKEIGVAVVQAMILAFIKEYPWSYISCRCHTELKLEDDVYRCNRCFRTIAKSIRRYRIKLDVFDGYDSAILVLNDAQVNELVGISCEDLLALNEDSLDGKYPPQLEEKLLGKEMLFKVPTGAGTNYYGEEFYEVMRICRDPDVIASFQLRDTCVTPLKAMFSPPFSELDGSLKGSDPESIEAEVLERRISADDSNIAVMNSSFTLSEYTESSVNKPIVHRPLKRKLIQEFDDAADEYSQLIQSVEHALQRRLGDKFSVYTKGECSRTHIAESAGEKQEVLKYEDVTNHNLSSTDEGRTIHIKCEGHVPSQKLNISSTVAEINRTNNSTDNDPELSEKKFEDNEIVDLTFVDDEVKVVCSQGGNGMKFNDLLHSSKIDDNFGLLIKEDEHEGGCIEVVYLSD